MSFIRALKPQTLSRVYSAPSQKAITSRYTLCCSSEHVFYSLPRRTFIFPHSNPRSYSPTLVSRTTQIKSSRSFSSVKASDFSHLKKIQMQQANVPIPLAIAAVAIAAVAIYSYSEGRDPKAGALMDLTNADPKVAETRKFIEDFNRSSDQRQKELLKEALNRLQYAKRLGGLSQRTSQTGPEGLNISLARSLLIEWMHCSDIKLQLEALTYLTSLLSRKVQSFVPISELIQLERHLGTSLLAMTDYSHALPILEELMKGYRLVMEHLSIALIQPGARIGKKEKDAIGTRIERIGERLKDSPHFQYEVGYTHALNLQLRTTKRPLQDSLLATLTFVENIKKPIQSQYLFFKENGKEVLAFFTDVLFRERRNMSTYLNQDSLARLSSEESLTHLRRTVEEDLPSLGEAAVHLGKDLRNVILSPEENLVLYEKVLMLKSIWGAPFIPPDAVKTLDKIAQTVKARPQDWPLFYAVKVFLKRSTRLPNIAYRLRKS